jgi:hypothetical protein
VKIQIPHRLNPVFLASAVSVTLSSMPVALHADDKHHEERSYHDNQHNDEHQWNDHEDRAYRIWAKENHRKYVNFAKLKAEQQQAYWSWRHDHSDAQLRIDIR